MPRYQVIRYTGVAGALLLAVAAVLGGALPTLPADLSLDAIWRGEHGPVVLGSWLAGTVLMTGAWWAARDGVPSARWAYHTIGLWLLPLLFAPPLGSRDVYAYACQGAVYAAGLDPYQSDIVALPCGPWLDSVSVIWRDNPAPYGPLFVMLAGGAVSAGGTLVATVAVFRLISVAGVGVTALFLPVLARRCGVSEQRALWLALCCPLVGVHLVSGAHNDAVMIGLLVAGLAVVAGGAGRPGPAIAGGVLLGLAVAVKATAVVVLPFAALAALAGPYHPRALVRGGTLVGGGALGAVLACTLTSGLGFGWVAGMAGSGESVQWTSPSTAVGMTIGYAARLVGLDIDAVPATRALGVVVLAVVLAVLWWRSRYRHPLHGAGLALLATVALAPVFHPWYATWPLAVLAATARPSRWFAIACAAASFIVLPDGTGQARFTKVPGALAMTALVVWVAVRGARRLLRERERRAELAVAAARPE